MTSQPLLELHIHLVNGSTHKFVQNDPQAVEQVLQQMNQTVFTQPTIVLFGQNSVTTYPTSALIGFSIIMEPVPDSLLRLTGKLRHGAGGFQEITEAEYKAGLQEMLPVIAGQPAVRLNEIEFLGGHRLWLELSVTAAANDMQERQIVKHAVEGPNVVCHRIGGGISIWNRARMISYSFTPKPEVPLPALALEPIA
jgi:hypothetical protein